MLDTGTVLQGVFIAKHIKKNAVDRINALRCPIEQCVIAFTLFVPKLFEQVTLFDDSFPIGSQSRQK